MAVVKESDPFADVSSHDAFVNGVPHATFKRLRENDPVCWFDEQDGSGFWAITRYDDIVEVNKNFKTFSSTQGIRMEEMAPDEAEARKSIMELDPPEHTRQRRLAGRGFTKKIVAEYTDQVAQIAADVIDQALLTTEFDFVSAVAKRVPMLMLGRLLGIPDEDGQWLVEKGDEMIANSDPDFTDHVIDQVDTDEFRLFPFRSPAGKELFEYAQVQAELRQQQPRKDILSLLLEPTADGTPLTDGEFNNFFALLASAGNDTTRYSIAAAMHVLANHPELVEQLRTADEALWDSAVEELIRWASPTMHFRRTATRPFELHDKTIQVGDKVILWFISGNRDDAAFADPFHIDLTRSPNPHMAFGRGGPHSCMGMWLARLEVRLVLQHFLKRVSSISQTAPQKHLRSNFINGIKYLPIAVEMV